MTRLTDVCSADVRLFHILFKGRLGEQSSHLKIYCTDLHQIFIIDTYEWARSNRPSFNDRK